MGIYLFTQEFVWYTTSFSGTCCFKEWVFIYLHMNLFNKQHVLVVHVVLRSGYLFIYTWMVWYTTSLSGTCCFKEWVFIYLHMNGLIYDIQQVLVVHVILRSGYLFIYTCMVWYTTSFSGTCCSKEWVFIYLHRNS